MGCIGSHLADLASGHGRLHRRRSNIFNVLNVDDVGRHLQTGKLEVKETDLVLYVNGRIAMTWPVRCLRRYGYEEDLFSFESGRRCPSGPGIYAFKCSRAQSLFNLLQARLQGNPTALPPAPTTPVTPSVHPSNLSPTFDYVNISENQNRPTQSAVSDSDVTVATTVGGIGVSHAKPNLPNCEDNNFPLYMNVDKPVVVKKSGNSHSQITNGQAQNRLGLQCNGNTFELAGSSSGTSLPVVNSAVYYTNVDCSLMSSTMQTTSTTVVDNVPAEVNYAELDLETDSKVVSMNSTSIAFNTVTKVSNPKKLRLIGMGSSLGEQYCVGKTKPEFECARDDSFLPSSGSHNELVGIPATSGIAPGDGYATIDFDRTAALSVVTRTKIKLDCNEENDNIIRKARHNSTAL